MKNKILLTSTLLVFWIGVFFVQSTAHAAPLGICVNILAGNWSSTATWSCFGASNPPGANDDVYIQYAVTVTDPRSAANVTIANGGSLNAGSSSLTVNNVTIDAGGALNCNSNTVTFKGSLTNNGTLDCSSGTADFQGTSTQSLNGSGNLTFNNLTVNNASNVVLNKDVTVNGVLALTNGDLNTASFVLNLGSGATVTAFGGGDAVGNVRRTHAFNTGTDYAFNSHYTLINFATLTTAPTGITINLVKATPTGLANAVPREYTISASGSPVFTGNLQLHYQSGEGGYATEGQLRPWKFINGTGWTVQPGSVTASGNNSFVKATNVTGFSRWGIAENNAPTAVNLSSFTADTIASPVDSMTFGFASAFLIGLIICGFVFLRSIAC